MSMRLHIFLAGFIGIVTGFFTIHSLLAHSSLSIFLWIAVGLGIIFFSSDRKTVICTGAIFGFFNIVSWLVTGFQGESHQLGEFLLLTLVLSILGAVLGGLGGYAFYCVRSLIKHKVY